MNFAHALASALVTLTGASSCDAFASNKIILNCPVRDSSETLRIESVGNPNKAAFRIRLGDQVEDVRALASGLAEHDVFWHVELQGKSLTAARFFISHREAQVVELERKDSKEVIECDPQTEEYEFDRLAIYGLGEILEKKPVLLQCTFDDLRGPGASLSIQLGGMGHEMMFHFNGAVRQLRSIKESSKVVMSPDVYKYGFTFEGTNKNFAAMFDVNEGSISIKRDSANSYSKCYPLIERAEFETFMSRMDKMVSRGGTDMQ